MIGERSGAKFDQCSPRTLSVVAAYYPNGYGLYDMAGNVWEWCEDDWHDNEKNRLDDINAWIDEPRGSYRVIRGGSWFNGALGCRSAFRGGFGPDDRFDFVGFRLARSVTLDP